MKSDKKRQILFFVSLIGIVLVTLVMGTTFAYQTLIVDYEEGADTDLTINVGKLNVTYTSTNKIELYSMPFLPDYKAADYVEFTMNNTESSNSVGYNIILKNLTYSEGLATSDFKYTLVELDKDNNHIMLYEGDFSDLSSTEYSLKSRYEKEYTYIDQGETQKLRLYLWLKESDSDQTALKNASFTASIEITSLFANEINDNLVTQFKIYGNTLLEYAEGTTEQSPDNPATILSLGDLITDTTDPNNGKYKLNLTTNGKNLINPATVLDENKYVVSNTGYLATPSETGGIWRVSDYISVTEGSTYHLNATNSNANAAGIAWYGIDKKYISGQNTTVVNNNNGNFTVPDNAYFVRVSWRINEGYNPDWQNTVQLELGNVETNFEPYMEPRTTNIYLNEPLRKVGNYSDYIDFETGKVIRQVRNLNINISDMNNTDSYPGWTNIQVLYDDYPNCNSVMPATSINNILNNQNLVAINTLNNKKGILWLRNSIINLSQTEWKARYPNLTFNLIYSITTPEEIHELLPTLSINDSNNIKVCSDNGVCGTVEKEFVK